MANDKKNTNELVPNDDDPTSELEAISLQAVLAGAVKDIYAEADADTFGFESGDEIPETDISILRSDLRSRSETIERLQFDVEQLRSKWLGLETEIKVREELAETLRKNAENAQQKASRKETLLKERNQTIKSLKAEIRLREEEHQSTRTRNESLQTKLAAGESQETKLREDLASAAEGLERHLAEISALHNDRRTIDDAASKYTREIDRLTKALTGAEAKSADLESYIAGRHDTWQVQDSEIKDLRRQLDSLNRDRNKPALPSQEEELRQDISRMAGRMASTNAELADAQTARQRLENLVDELRQSLQDRIGELDNASAAAELRDKSLSDARRRMSDLEVDTSSLRAELDDLQFTLIERNDRHGEETAKLRSELDQALDKVTEHELIAQQLGSDLIDSKNFRIELERMLKHGEKKSQKQIGRLEKRVKKLQAEARDNEEKIATKNEAINCLLAELTRKNQEFESIGDLEGVIHEIDNRISERIDERQATDRDRFTRVLIGKVGNKDLRFPLFKNRLTIGRTKQNDIQLKAAYISRRHAVIVTEAQKTRVIDWGSKNGVYVNSKKVTEHFLCSGDIVSIGNAEFRYEERPKRDGKSD